MSNTATRKYKQWTPEALASRDAARKEARIELNHLKDDWPTLRRHMGAESLALAWFLFGEKMFDKRNKYEADRDLKDQSQ